jgi:hypothetical protein
MADSFLVSRADLDPLKDAAACDHPNATILA